MWREDEIVIQLHSVRGLLAVEEAREKGRLLQRQQEEDYQRQRAAVERRKKKGGRPPKVAPGARRKNRAMVESEN